MRSSASSLSLRDEGQVGVLASQAVYPRLKLEERRRSSSFRSRISLCLRQRGTARPSHGGLSPGACPRKAAGYMLDGEGAGYIAPPRLPRSLPTCQSSIYFADRGNLETHAEIACPSIALEG